jgi:hypothetical protein
MVLRLVILAEKIGNSCTVDKIRFAARFGLRCIWLSVGKAHFIRLLRQSLQSAFCMGLNITTHCDR